MKPILIDINDYVKSGEGANGSSYDHIRDNSIMVKLYNPDYPTDTIAVELDVARKAYELGIPSPEPGELVTDGERIGIRFKRIVGKRSHARAVSQEPERCAEFAREFARMCVKFHSIECPKGTFPDAKEQFLNLVAAEKCFTDSEKAPIRAFIQALPDTTTVLHGDMHLGNTLTTLPIGAPFSEPHETYFIDLGYLSQGYPMLDLGMLQNICLYAGEDFRVESFHIDGRMTAEFWDYFVDEYFFGNDHLAEKYFGKGADKAAVNEGLKKFTAVKLFLVSYNIGMMPPLYEKFVRNVFGLY